MIRVNIDLLYLANDYFWYYEGHLFTGIGYEMEDGILAVESSYQEGMLDGITKIYENSHLSEEITYFNGNMIATKELYCSGEIKLENTYDFGICISTRYFDEQGGFIHEQLIDEKNPSFELLQILKRSIDSRPLLE
jgi:hypothetical protein